MTPHPLLRLAHRFYMAQARFTRGMTMGVRALALDAQGRIFLVRHTYVPGWHLPGGAVDPGETTGEALLREMAEEGHLLPGDPPVLHGVFLNRLASPRDHVVAYVMRNVRQERPRLPDREIADSGFFALDSLPSDTTRATRDRLAEFFEGRTVSAEW